MVKIITDSSSELLANYQEKYNITVLPMPINFGKETYLSSVNITNEEFYKKLKQSTSLPTTSMVNEFSWEESFAKELKKGNEIIAVTISSKMSLTYEQANNAAKKLDNKKIYVVDSLNASFGQAQVVLEAIRLKDEGLNAKEIQEKLNKFVHKVRVIAFVDTLHYLKMGGRLKSSAAMIGTLLKVKPIVGVEKGSVVSKSKAIGKPNAFKKLVSLLKEIKIDKSKRIIIAHADDEKTKDEFKKFITDELQIIVSDELELGSTIGVHVGPGAVGISVVEE